MGNKNRDISLRHLVACAAVNHGGAMGSSSVHALLPPSFLRFVTLTLVHSLLLYSEPEGDPVRVVEVTIIIIVVFVVFR